jgi:hypothetical protein
MPLCLVEAKSSQEARSIAEDYHIFYSNQLSEAVPASKARRKDVSEVVDSVDNDVYKNDRGVVRHAAVVATVEPWLEY